MIGVFVTFRYGDNFDERAVRKIAETARVRFEGMPGLAQRPSRSIPKSVRPRTSTFGIQRTRKAFFTDELIERVAGLRCAT